MDLSVVNFKETGEVGTKFSEILQSARRHLDEIKAIPAISFSIAKAKLPTGPGIYVLYEGDQPIYVGRARDLRKRIRQHVNGTLSGSTFAFLLARNETKRQATYRPSGSRTDLLKNDTEFKSAFDQAIKKILQMTVKFVEIEDDNLQYFFEFLCALEFETKHNKFRTT